MIGKTFGASTNFERGFTDQENWHRKFAFQMHTSAELAMQSAIMKNQDFSPVVIFVRSNGYLVISAGEYTTNENTKDMLADELHDAAKKSDIIGILMINDCRLRRSPNDPDFEDAIFTNAQWRDGETLNIITKYVKKNDIETEFKTAEVPIYDLAIGRFSNFFRK